MRTNDGVNAISILLSGLFSLYCLGWAIYLMYLSAKDSNADGVWGIRIFMLFCLLAVVVSVGFCRYCYKKAQNPW